MAGSGGGIEVAVDEAGAERGEDGAGLGGEGAEAHDGDGPGGVVDEEGGEALEVAPGGDAGGDFEAGGGAGLELRLPFLELRGGGGFGDGMGGEDDGFSRAAGLSK